MDLKTGNIRKLYFKFLFPKSTQRAGHEYIPLRDMIVVGLVRRRCRYGGFFVSYRPLSDLILLPECIIRQRRSRLIQCGTRSREKI